MANNPNPTFDELLNIQFDPPSVKKTKEYGLKFAKSVFAKDGSLNDFFLTRNQQLKENADFAMGKVDKKDFLSKLGVEGDKSWNNLDWTLLKIVPRYYQWMKGVFMNRDEKPSVKATDILSRRKRTRQKLEAKHRMINAQVIAEMENAAGQKFEDGFTPQDQDELDIWDKTNNRLPYESVFEQTIQEIFQNNDYENLKDLILGDLIRDNFGIIKIERLNTKTKTLAQRATLRRIKPSRAIYNSFESPIGKDITIIGEVSYITIAEARKMYPGIKDEKDWLKLANVTSRNAGGLNSLEWNDTYINSLQRPYDDYKFQRFDFEVKVFDRQYYVQKVNKSGQDRIFPKGTPTPPENGELVEEGKYNIYCGAWATGTDIMLNWDLAPNIIRPYQNGIDCFSNYTLVSPDADGTLIPSLLERGNAIVRQLVLCALKIQQMMLEMRADGLMIDIKNLRGLNLGQGFENMQPLEVLKIYDANGKLFFDSGDDSGTDPDVRKDPPFQHIQNGGNAAQINTLIGLYNFLLGRLNDEWGTNPDALGQQLPARRAKGVNENQIEVANQQTEYIYDHFVYLMKMVANKLAFITWDHSVFEAQDYGTEEMSKDIMQAMFDVNIDMIPTAEMKQRLQEKVNIALQQGLISLGNAIKIENMDNIKDAELYLIKLEKQAMDAAAQKSQNDIAMTAQVQQDSANTNSKNAINEIREKAKADDFVTKGKLQQEGFNSMIDMAKGIALECLKANKPVPPEYSQFIKFIVQTAITKANPPQQDQQAPPQEAQEPPAQEQAEPQQEIPQQEMAETM